MISSTNLDWAAYATDYSTCPSDQQLLPQWTPVDYSSSSPAVYQQQPPTYATDYSTFNQQGRQAFEEQYQQQFINSVHQEINTPYSYSSDQHWNSFQQPSAQNLSTTTSELPPFPSYCYPDSNDYQNYWYQ